MPTRPRPTRARRKPRQDHDPAPTTHTPVQTGYALSQLDRLPAEARGVSAMRAAFVTSLQRGYGNQAVQRLIADHPTKIQRHSAAQDSELVSAAQKASEPLEQAIEPPKPQDERGVVQRLVQREVGIAKERTVKKFTGAIQDRLKQKQQMTPIELLHLLTTQIRDRLKDHKVHEPTVRNDRTLAKETGGFFGAGLWEIRLNEAVIKDTTEAGVKTAAATAYHEARHAEQWFNLIRHVIYKHRETSKTGIDNPATVRAMLGGGVNEQAIQAAFGVTEKTKKFDKSVKQTWARSQYEERFDPEPDQFTGALGGARNPRHKRVMDALEHADQALTRVNDQKETFDRRGGSYPLKTEHWEPALAAKVAVRYDTWAYHNKKLNLIREQITADKLEKAAKESEAQAALKTEAGPETKGTKATTEKTAPQSRKAKMGRVFNVPKIGKEVPHELDGLAAELAFSAKEAEQDYLDLYGVAVTAEQKRLHDAYLAAFKAYQDLPWEDDAFKTQALVEKHLK